MQKKLLLPPPHLSLPGSDSSSPTSPPPRLTNFPQPYFLAAYKISLNVDFSCCSVSGCHHHVLIYLGCVCLVLYFLRLLQFISFLQELWRVDVIVLSCILSLWGGGIVFLLSPHILTFRCFVASNAVGFQIFFSAFSWVVGWTWMGERCRGYSASDRFYILGFRWVVLWRWGQGSLLFCLVDNILGWVKWLFWVCYISFVLCLNFYLFSVRINITNCSSTRRQKRASWG